MTTLSSPNTTTNLETGSALLAHVADVPGPGEDHPSHPSHSSHSIPAPIPPFPGASGGPGLSECNVVAAPVVHSAAGSIQAAGINAPVSAGAQYGSLIAQPPLPHPSHPSHSSHSSHSLQPPVFGGRAQHLQPVPDIRSYLATRTPVPHYTDELPLWLTLPAALRAEVKALHAAYLLVQALVNDRLNVGAACATIHRAQRVRGSLSRFRNRYDQWAKSGDWITLVDRARAGGPWQAERASLPLEFLQFCAQRFAAYKRADGKRQALAAIHRQYLTGRNPAGQLEPIPGYNVLPASCRQGQQGQVPPGWSYSNILAQIKRRNLFPRAVQALAHQSTAAARSYIPQTRFDRNTAGAHGGPLRFLERVEFDDVKCDFRVLDTSTGMVCDLWLLIARDLGTARLLGFGLRPARARDDGSQEHLKLQDMKQLCGWLLERYGLPPYEVTWKIEHGTATLSAGSAAALQDLLPGRIRVSFSSMLGSTSPDGYRERAIGNSKGKASLESQNRLLHTMAAHLPGQTGPRYEVRPQDLAAREREAVQIWRTAQQLPEHLRAQVEYPVLSLNQTRAHLFNVFHLQNQRTDHDLQGFEDVIERCAAPSLSHPMGEGQGEGALYRRRKESPDERCARLIAPYSAHWSAVSPDIIAAFYAHTQRAVRIQPNGLISFTSDDRSLEFAPPGDHSSHASYASHKQLLAYHHPDDPAYLHLTDGRGSYLGTWLRRSRASDPDSLQAAIRYSQAALKAARTHAEALCAPERNRLEAMRVHNAALLDSNTFVDISGSSLQPPASSLVSPVAAALSAIPRARAQIHDTRAAAQQLAASLDAV